MFGLFVESHERWAQKWWKRFSLETGKMLIEALVILMQTPNNVWLVVAVLLLLTADGNKLSWCFRATALYDKACLCLNVFV